MFKASLLLVFIVFAPAITSVVMSVFGFSGISVLLASALVCGVIAIPFARDIPKLFEEKHQDPKKL